MEKKRSQGSSIEKYDYEFLQLDTSLYAVDQSIKIYKSTKRAAEKVSIKHHLYPVTVGLGTGKNDQDLIEIGFDYDSKPLLIDEARAKLISCFQDYLTEINLDQQLQKAFCVTPIKPEDVNFYILNYDENHANNILHPFISEMEVNEGEVVFSTYRIPLQRKAEMIKETYEEALEKLQKWKTN